MVVIHGFFTCKIIVTHLVGKAINEMNTKTQRESLGSFCSPTNEGKIGQEEKTRNRIIYVIPAGNRTTRKSNYCAFPLSSSGQVGTKYYLLPCQYIRLSTRHFTACSGWWAQRGLNSKRGSCSETLTHLVLQLSPEVDKFVG